jgi:hypothetical protein
MSRMCDFCGVVEVSGLHVEVEGERQCLTCWEKYMHPHIETIYKVGDRVRIRENVLATKSMHDFFSSLEPPYTLIVKEMVGDKYRMEEEDGFLWSDSDIEGICEESILNPIENRWEILDL